VSISGKKLIEVMNMATNICGSIIEYESSSVLQFSYPFSMLLLPLLPLV